MQQFHTTEAEALKWKISFTTSAPPKVDATHTNNFPKSTALGPKGNPGIKGATGSKGQKGQKGATGSKGQKGMQLELVRKVQEEQLDKRKCK